MQEVIRLKFISFKASIITADFLKNELILHPVCLSHSVYYLSPLATKENPGEKIR